MRFTTKLVALAILSIPIVANADDDRTRVATVYGVEEWDRVEELRYTFNVKVGEREVRRSWIWRPKDKRVTFRDELSKDEPFSYNLDDVGDNPPEELKNIDHRFINDQYWLLFALHIAWDQDATVTRAADQRLPIGEGSATKLTVQYPDTGGYTPGDAYDIYIGPDDHVVQWVFREGGQAEASLATTWENHQRFGPLLIPTEFKSDDGSFQLWFSDVAVTSSPH
jgi:hypothetical protein